MFKSLNLRLAQISANKLRMRRRARLKAREDLALTHRAYKKLLTKVRMLPPQSEQNSEERITADLWEQFKQQYDIAFKSEVFTTIIKEASEVLLIENTEGDVSQQDVTLRLEQLAQSYGYDNLSELTDSRMEEE